MTVGLIPKNYAALQLQLHLLCMPSTHTHMHKKQALLMLRASVYFPMLSISGNLCRDSLASSVFIALTG